jgi:3-oxoacyl-[acyl-carrier protein] reductase
MHKKTVFMTGSAGGIGVQLTHDFLKKGFRVVASDISLGRLRDFFSEYPEDRLLLLELDVCDPQQWDQAILTSIQKFGSIDLLVHTAGVLAPDWILNLKEEDVHRHVDINIKGTMWAVSKIARQIHLQNTRGHLILFSSLAGLSPIPGLSLYSATKCAVRSFGISAGLELKKHRIAVTVLCPDAVQTPMADLQRQRKEAALTFSGGRILTVEEISDAIFGYVLKRKPLELALPMSRGLMAKVGNLFPRMTGTFAEPLLRKKGELAQSKLNTSGSDPLPAQKKTQKRDLEGFQ